MNGTCGFAGAITQVRESEDSSCYLAISWTLT